MLVPLLALQLSAVQPRRDSVYSSPALAAFIAAAAQDNRVPPAELRGYSARVESELALLVRDTIGRERAAQVEQLAMSAHWARGGNYDLRIVGYRSQTVGVPYSALSFARGWTIPYLYGDRLTLGVDFGEERSAGKDSLRRERAGNALRGIHFLASDRDRFYRFAGGDTIAVLRLHERRVPIVRVRVEPVFDSAARNSRIGAFEGEVDFDADRHQIVRMRGRFVATEGRRSRFGLARLPGVVGVAYVEFVNAEVQGRYWLPAYQRSEFQAAFAPLGTGRSIFRLVSRFNDVNVVANVDSATATNSEASAVLTGGARSSQLAEYSPKLSYASADSVSGYGAWLQPLGDATAKVHGSDFDDLAPDVWRANGRPRLELAPTKVGELFRYNRVEGLYTGLAGDERFRDAAPGLSAHLYGGWAWTEKTARGGGSIGFQRSGWSSSVRAERLLASTNDFTPPLEGGSEGFGALFAGVDDHDYVDRRLAAANIIRTIGGPAGALALLEGSIGEDRSELSRVSQSPFRFGQFRPNRASADGRYVRGAAIIEIHPDVTGLYLEPGLGAILQYEVAGGELAWQRAEVILAVRENLSDFVIAMRAQGGLVAGRTIPPQTLLELGGENALPGYDYKEFAGDRAVAAGALAAYTLPIMRRPWRVVRSLMLPGLSPGFAIGAQGGWTEASTSSARAALERLTPGFDPNCQISNTCPAPVSVPSRGIRATIDARLTLFGGLIGVGVARPVDHAAPWRLAFRFGEEY